MAMALLSCGTTRGARDQTAGCRDKSQESDIPSSHTFVFLPVPRSSSSFSVPAPVVIRDETKPGTVLMPGTGNSESQAAGRGKGCAMASHQPLTQLLPSSTIITHWRCQPGLFALFFRLWQLMLPRESLCFGSCGLGKTLKELIYNEQFPGLKTCGRERLGFVLPEPLEVLKRDLRCLLAGVVFPKGIKSPAGKAFPPLPAAAGCREPLLSPIPPLPLLWVSLAGMEQRRAGGIEWFSPKGS